MPDNVVVNVNCGEQKPTTWEQWQSIAAVLFGIVTSFAAGNGCMAIVKGGRPPEVKNTDESRIRGEIARVLAENESRQKQYDARVKAIEAEKLPDDVRANAVTTLKQMKAESSIQACVQLEKLQIQLVEAITNGK